jgi:hypothetical protein
MKNGRGPACFAQADGRVMDFQRRLLLGNLNSRQNYNKDRAKAL